MDEQAAQPLLALCAEELADLVARVFDTWTPEPERFTLPDVFGNTQGQLGEVLQKLQPGLKVLYGTDTIQTYPAADNAVRRRYGWFQRYSIGQRRVDAYFHHEQMLANYRKMYDETAKEYHLE